MTTSNPKFSKKDVRRIVYNKLAQALDEYRDSFKKKRFTGNLKKASNLFAEDILKAMKKVNGRATNGKAKDKFMKPKNHIETMPSNTSVV